MIKSGEKSCRIMSGRGRQALQCRQAQMNAKIETSGWGEKSVEDSSPIKEHGTYGIQKLIVWSLNRHHGEST